MRLTEFWQRMDEHLGVQAQTFAHDRVLGELGGRTVEEALAQGTSAKDVWRGVCAATGVPAFRR